LLSSRSAGWPARDTRQVEAESFLPDEKDVAVMKTVGLTGGIASGKSTAIAVLRQAGAVVLSADAIAHTLMQPGQAVWKNIADYFGAGVLRPDRSIDRAALGAVIFSRAEQRAKLNEISHPYILQALRDELAQIERARPDAAVFAEVPLLFEVGWDGMFTEAWTVWVDFSTQLRRLMLRDKLSEADARTRIAAQLSLDEKARRSDRVIDNSGTKEQTEEKTGKLYRSFLLGPSIG
jgi:dephospho-CoA kinase